ncbi:hypothetical protein AB6D66_01050 [Vibrio pomeroyi]|uniref:ParB/Sulfiredoxin domain-containing protein n=1 Tax=Vibrio pomeroyi TaxID=198832 RepID=A0ABV4MR63_9VIBR|nr:hypothetical protein [Vibrio atlanticus]MCZ4310289.1 hypothetical protein [Vibrio atlanticus]
MENNKDKKTVVRGGNAGLGKMALARQALLDKQKKTDEQNKEGATETPKVIDTGSKDCRPDDLPIATVSPDPENARDFPVIKPAAEKMFLANPKNEGSAYVILDSGLLENKTPKDHPLFDHIERQIDDIINLAKQIEDGGGIYQAIEVYRAGGTDYRIVFGHRRFYSVVYLLGWDDVWSFKVHRAKPESPKLRQFVENSSRSDLVLHERIRAFKLAVDELNSNAETPLSYKECQTKLGISKTSFYELSKFSEFELVYDATRAGIGLITKQTLNSIFSQMPKQGTADDETYRANSEEFLIKQLALVFIEAGKELPTCLKLEDDDTGQAEETLPPVSVEAKAPRGRRTSLYSAPKMKTTLAVKTLLTSDVTKMEIDGVNWDEVDWEDRVQVNECLTATIKALEAMKE